MSQLFSGSSLLGAGMLVRMRSSTIGILGIVAAVGLGLVAFISQQGWPGSVNEPLPQSPPRFLQNDTLAAPVAVVARPDRRFGVRQDRDVERRAPGADTSPRSEYELTSGRQVGSAPVDPQPAAPQPDIQPEPEPDPAPPATSAPTSSPPVSVPVVAAADGDESPGRAGKSRGRSSRAAGPPPWTGQGSYDDYRDAGDQEYDDDDDQYEYDDGDEDDGEYDGHRGHGRPDWAGH